MRIKRFRAVRPPGEHVEEVACPPYDVVEIDEAKAIVSRKPSSFLRVIRPEVDLDAAATPEAVWQKAAENLSSYIERGLLVEDERESIFVYRQMMPGHEQHGIFACGHVGEYAAGHIRRHEDTRDDKVRDRIGHIKATRANTGPVFLTYRGEPDIDQAVAASEEGEPIYDFLGHGGVRHTVWRAVQEQRIVDTFERVSNCYVADGHHRLEAAASVAQDRGAAGDESEYDWFLCTLIPAEQVRILPYNRCVSELNGMSPAEFVEAAGRVFKVDEHAEPAPRGPHQVSMYMGGRWYGLSWPSPGCENGVPVLDVGVLQSALLGPLLGILNPRVDSRISFVGGLDGVGALVRCVDEGRAIVGFSMHPVSVEEMMAMADGGKSMSPKSTWFEPKLKSGLLVHMLETIRD